MSGAYYFTCEIRGTPAQFGNMVKRFTRSFDKRGERDPYSVMDSARNTLYTAQADPICVELGRRRINRSEQTSPTSVFLYKIPLGYVIAASVPSPEPKTILEVQVITAVDTEKEGAQYWWELLYKELGRLDLVIGAKEPQPVAVTSPIKPTPTPFDLLPNTDKKKIETVKKIIHRRKRLGKTYKESSGKEGINESTFRRWRKKYAPYL